MRQIGLPIEDISTGGWTPSVDLYKRINQWCGEANDDTCARSKVDPDCENHNYDTFEVKLPPFACPKEGECKVVVRIADTGEPAFARITLLSGSTVIKKKIVSLWDPPSQDEVHDHEVTFGQDELDSIDDYADLRIRVEACWGCCFYIHYPLNLRARFVNVSDCDDLDGMEIPLTYNVEAGQRWDSGSPGSSSSSSSSGCEHANFDLVLWCQPLGAEEWALMIYCDCDELCNCDAYVSETSLNCDCVTEDCDPFSLTFEFSSVCNFYEGCGCEWGGQFRVIIEEDT